jgi:hypothetical protein
MPFNPPDVYGTLPERKRRRVKEKWYIVHMQDTVELAFRVRAKNKEEAKERVWYDKYVDRKIYEERMGDPEIIEVEEEK